MMRDGEHVSLTCEVSEGSQGSVRDICAIQFKLESIDRKPLLCWVNQCWPAGAEESAEVSESTSQRGSLLGSVSSGPAHRQKLWSSSE